MKTNPNQPMFLGFEPIITQLPDGAVKVTPGKAIISSEDTISAKQAAQILLCGQHTIYRYVREGLLTARQTKPKARLRVSREEVLALKEKEA